MQPENASFDPVGCMRRRHIKSVSFYFSHYQLCSILKCQVASKSQMVICKQHPHANLKISKTRRKKWRWWVVGNTEFSPQKHKNAGAENWNFDSRIDMISRRQLRYRCPMFHVRQRQPQICIGGSIAKLHAPQALFPS